MNTALVRANSAKPSHVPSPTREPVDQCCVSSDEVIAMDEHMRAFAIGAAVACASAVRQAERAYAAEFEANKSSMEATKKS